MGARLPSESVVAAASLVTVGVVPFRLSSHWVGSSGCDLVAWICSETGGTGMVGVEAVAVGPTVSHGGYLSGSEDGS